LHEGGECNVVRSDRGRGRVATGLDVESERDVAGLVDRAFDQQGIPAGHCQGTLGHIAETAEEDLASSRIHQAPVRRAAGQSALVEEHAIASRGIERVHPRGIAGRQGARNRRTRGRLLSD
jgi:hypothetical protein